jgi:hypothetical protein
MLFNLLSKLEPVHIAKTEKEKEALYRLRYQVYVSELKKGFLTSVNDQKQWVQDPEDLRPQSTLFYTGKPSKPSGTMRVDIWSPDQVPDALTSRFNLKNFPQIKRKTIAEISRLVILKQKRGLMILPALARYAFEYICKTKQVDLAFLYCAPGLVNAYKKLGYRSYEADVIHNEDGVRIPMVFIPDDIDYLRSVRSPLLSVAKKIYQVKSPQKGQYDHLVDSSPFYQLDEAHIWQDLQKSILSDSDQTGIFLRRLSPEVLHFLSSKGLLVKVGAGKKMVRKGLSEQEMFVILEGHFEVIKNDKRVAVLGKGDVFGEMAFFLESNQRSATVRAITPGRVLILRRHFLNTLIQKHPKWACDVLLGLCQTLTQRLNLMAGH